MTFSAQNWNKIRSDYRTWANKVLWIIPTKVYAACFIGGIAYMLYKELFNRFDWLERIVILITVISIVKLSDREKHEEGYIDGINEASSIIKHGGSLDDLLKD